MKGFTLIEVLATLVILMIVLIPIFSLFNSSLSEQVKQTKANQNIQEFSYALKVLTKDFRKAKNYDVQTQILDYVVVAGDPKSVQYVFENNELKRLYNMNGHLQSTEVIGHQVTSFLICHDAIPSGARSCTPPSQIDSTFYISIVNTAGQEIQTVVTIRGGK
jgi:prepilin-type N-terminal cleavage/methylation domain-containing protein